MPYLSAAEQAGRTDRVADRCGVPLRESRWVVGSRCRNATIIRGRTPMTSGGPTQDWHFSGGFPILELLYPWLSLDVAK